MQGEDKLRTRRKNNYWLWAFSALVLTASPVFTVWFTGRQHIHDAFVRLDPIMILGVVVVFFGSLFFTAFGLLLLVIGVKRILLVIRKPKEGDELGRVLREAELDIWRKLWKVWGPIGLITFIGTGLMQNLIKQSDPAPVALYTLGLFWTLAAYGLGSIQSRDESL